MKQEYPKWIYPDGDVAKGFIVKDAEEHAARASETKTYADGSMATGLAPLPDQSPEEQHTVETLRTALDAAGIAYDKRLGLEKLKALLPK